MLNMFPRPSRVANTCTSRVLVKQNNRKLEEYLIPGPYIEGTERRKAMYAFTWIMRSEVLPALVRGCRQAC